MQLTLGGFSTVTMTDRWFQELRAGRAFTITPDIAPGVGNYAHAQIKNPAGSGKQAIIALVRVTLAAAGYVWWGRYDTDLTTDAGTMFNLLLGGAASACHCRTQSPNAKLGSLWGYMYLPINTPTPIYPTWGVEISPGGGLVVVAAATNVEMIADFLVNEV